MKWLNFISEAWMNEWKNECFFIGFKLSMFFTQPFSLSAAKPTTKLF